MKRGEVALKVWVKQHPPPRHPIGRWLIHDSYTMIMLLQTRCETTQPATPDWHWVLVRLCYILGLLGHLGGNGFVHMSCCGVVGCLLADSHWSSHGQVACPLVARNIVQHVNCNKHNVLALVHGWEDSCEKLLYWSMVEINHVRSALSLVHGWN